MYTSSDPAEHLKIALRDGSVPHKDDLFLIHGPGGVGKSSLISMFLGEERDLARVSTALAEESRHVCPVRDMLTRTFTEQWEPVDIDRQASMVAHTSRCLPRYSTGDLDNEDESSDVKTNESTKMQEVSSRAVNTPELSGSMEYGAAIMASSRSYIPRTEYYTHTLSQPSSNPSILRRLSQIPSKLWKSIRQCFRQSRQPITATLPSFTTAEGGIPYDSHVPLNTIVEDTQPNLENMEEKEVEEGNAIAAVGQAVVDSIPEDTIPIVEHDEAPLVSSLGNDPDNIESSLVIIHDNLQNVMCKSKILSGAIPYYSIHVVDSGGQPQFHEVVSIILPAATGIVSVFKLSEPLDIHGEVVFYKHGVEANNPYKSYLTNEQVIRHDLLAIQSEAHRSCIEEMPVLAFVGTFLDQQDACPEETPDQKDKRLHSMITDILPVNMQGSVISSGESLRQVTFKMNTRTPSHVDYSTAGKLKEALMNCSRVKSKKLPLKWFWYEVNLCKVMKHVKRQTLSLDECEFIGYKLGFDSISLKACLYYLRKFHIIFFHEVLPNVIFGTSQVILDKITELVTFSLELKKGNIPCKGVERKFHRQGILGLNILQSKSCSKHYIKDIFTPEDLLTILKALLIITEVGSGEYLMPSVLEVSDVYPSPLPPEDSVRSSIVLHFSKKSPMLGIYCCTISYLLTVAHWNLLKEDGEVVQVARNSITFEIPNNIAGKLTFVDPLSSYFEVVVQLPKIVFSKCSEILFHEIRDTFIAAMKQAMQTLNYEVRTPELSFLCPEQSSRCSIFPHLAAVDEKHELLTCSRNPSSVCHPVSSDQMKWLPPSKHCSHHTQ